MSTPNPTTIESTPDTVIETPTNDNINQENRLDSLTDQLTGFMNGIKSCLKEIKEIKKDYVKEKKILVKAAETKAKKSSAKKDGKPTVSSFSKPQVLSSNLKEFFSFFPDEMIPRTDVTKRITVYVKAHHLLNEKNKREIDVWAKSEWGNALRKLLAPATGDVVTWFNLQKYLAPHYVKQDTTAPIAEVTPPAPAPVEPAPVSIPTVKKSKHGRSRTKAPVSAPAVVA